MTHHTDTERAEFEQIMRDSQSYKPELLKWIGDRYEFDTMESAWHGFQLGWQAARRTTAMPLKWSSLLQEARDNCMASTAEKDITPSRRTYRQDLLSRLNALLAEQTQTQTKQGD